MTEDGVALLPPEQQIDLLVEGFDGRVDEDSIGEWIINDFECKACAVNNGGLSEQIAYLVSEHGYSAAVGILNSIKRRGS